VKPLLFISLILTLGLSFSEPVVQQNKPLKLLVSMFDSIKNIRTLQTKIHAIERIDNTFNTAHSEIKVNTHPRKLYFINPAKKLEVLYNAEISKKAVVKPHVFPYMTVHLDPLGNLMRKSQHYTIHELGFEFIAKTIALTLKNEKEIPEHFTYHGKVQKNGYTCHLLQFEDDSYSYRKYTVGEKETATSIAYKLCVNEYLLRHKNDLLNEFSYLKKGRVIGVPTLYCKKAVIYVDEKQMLPVSISLFDDEGLFESYTFSAISINKPFPKDEFLVTNTTYGF
jgi:hypothetical protein